MKASRAPRLLELAARMGIVPPADDRDDDDARLARLVDSGALSPATLAELERELGAAPVEPDGFVLEAKLGEGGMGEVWRARDRRLNRVVALKLLRRDDARALGRFVREAQAQARLEHPHVCHVYETGELDGRPFIAMQLVDGPTLAAAGPGLPLIEQLAILAQVASAVEAAHGLGIIHRDLKPGNVLISRTPAGGWHAWVTDFGLARDIAVASATTHDVLGTPEFMSPEQARGQTVDARADIWSLGATLYGVLAGQPPFAGNPGQVLERLLMEEVPPLHAARPDLPLDVCTIVDRCLERDPARRYASAGELAADLRRFLDGEPILARPLSAPSRLLRRIWKRPAGAVVALSVLAVAGAAAAMIHARRIAARDAELTTHFAEEAASLDGELRQAHLMPAHDLTVEIAAVRARLDAISALRRRGSAAAAADDALGRGLLALGDVKPAAQALEQAWAGGRRSPETALALGLARAQIYRSAVKGLDDSTAEADRPAARAKLRSTLGAEVIRALEAARGGRRVEYAEGLLADVEERLPEALLHAERALAAEPTFYEALTLSGDVHLALGEEHDRSSHADEARREYDAAAAAYRRAREIGRSDPALATSDCQRAYERVFSLSYQGHDSTALANDGIAECESVSALLPRSTLTLIYAAMMAQSAGEALMNRGGDGMTWFDRAEALARRAVALAPNDADAASALGPILGMKAEALIDRGRDPTPLYEEAVATLQRALAIAKSSPIASRDLAQCCQSFAQYQLRLKRDPSALLDKAGAAMQRAVEVEPGDDVNWLLLGRIDQQRADWEHEHGRPWLALQERAIANLKHATAIKPQSKDALNDLALCWNRRAEMERSTGGDPAVASKKSLEVYDRARVIAPDDFRLMADEGAAWSTLAAEALDRGDDPRPALGHARELFERARARISDAASPVVGAASTFLLEARAALARGEDPRAAASRAIELAAEGAKIDPQSAQARYLAGAAETVLAEDALLHHRSPDAALARGQSELARAAQLDDLDPDQLFVLCDHQRVRALASRKDAVAAGLALAHRIGWTAGGLECAGRLELIAARQATDSAARDAARQRAAADLAKLLQQDPRRRPRVQPWTVEAGLPEHAARSAAPP